MLAGLRQGVVVDGVDVVEEGVVEVIHHRRIDDRKAQFLGVQHLDALAVGAQELKAALVQGTGGALGNLNHKGAVHVGDFKGTVEVLAGVDAAGIQPLHLHKDADALHIGRAVPRAAAHGVDDAVVLVFLGKGQGALRHLGAGFADNGGEHLPAGQELLVVFVPGGLLEQLHRH